MKKVMFFTLLFSYLTFPSLSNGQSTIMILGDSLSNNYQLTPGQSWGSLLQHCIHNMHSDILVVNKSRNKLTTQQGIKTLYESLPAYYPDIVIVALGTIDAQQDHSVAEVQNNFQKILNLIHNYEAKVVLAGSPLSNQKYAAVFAHFSKTQQVLWLEDLYNDINKPDKLLLADSIHANSKGQKVIMNTVWKVLYPILDI